MSHVEVFVTMQITIESSDQSPFWGWSRDEGDLWAGKIIKLGTCGCNLTFDPLKIKSSRASEGNDQAHFLPIKNLDPSRKLFNKWHIKF